MIRLTLTAVALAVSGAAVAKLPPLDDAAKAKAAETAARATWQAKVDTYKLCLVQDRVAAAYKKTAATRPAAAVPAGAVVPTSAAPAATPAAAAAPAAAAPVAAAPATAAPAAAKAATPAATAGATPSSSGKPTTTAEGGGTPVPNVATTTVAAAPAIPGCADPGPFAFNAPAQTPLETSGAHSPAGNAVSPPSVRPESAKMAPSGAATPQSKKP